MVNEADPYIFFYDGEIDGMKLHAIVKTKFLFGLTKAIV